ncbi:hypothetical protein V5O48_000280 [Marasmius crinis-equi]|uniref:F-box domain-containing protein n=1 Tax=Marasmius crinis-equi TaxID=585013 RepID=A0ABR3G283_9AGAR
MSPAMPPSTTLPEYRRDGGDSQSGHSRSRAVSPIRILQQWSANISRNHSHQEREEPFVPIDPFHFNFRLIPSFLSSLFTSQRAPEDNAEHPIVRPFSPDIEAQIEGSHRRHRLHSGQKLGLDDQQLESTYVFLTYSLPRIVYLHILLRLPAMYFSRVARIFEDAEVSRPDIQRMVEGCFGGASAYEENQVDGRDNRGTMGRAGDIPDTTYQDTPRVTPALRRFKHSWEDFISSLLREWKTLNVVSALLLSAILTMFQIPNAASDPLTRTAALLSLICAIMALSYGCSVNDPDEREGLSPKAILGPRIAITAVFLLGIIYFFAILRTLQSYGRVEPLERRKGSRFYAQRQRPFDASVPAGNEAERRGRGTQRASRQSRRGGHLDAEGHTPRERRDSLRKDNDEGDDEKVEVPTPKGGTIGLGLTGVTSLGASMSVIEHDTGKEEKDKHHFEIINLDKVQAIGRWTSLYDYFSVPDTLQDLTNVLGSNDSRKSWAGDRIICRGDRILEYPDGLLTPVDRRNLESGAFKRVETCLVTDDTGAQFKVLRNLSKHQYVRTEGLLLDSEQARLPSDAALAFGLMRMLLSRICWSSFGPRDLKYNRSWPGAPSITRGSWAGDRFDLQPDHGFERDGVEWVDVTEKAARLVFEVLSERPARMTSPLSPFPSLPWEIVSHILKEVAMESKQLAAELCRVSQSACRDILPILYRNPVVGYQQTDKFRYAMEIAGTSHPWSNRAAGSMINHLFLEKPDVGLLRSCPDVKFLAFGWARKTIKERVHPQGGFKWDDSAEWSGCAPSTIIFGPCESTSLPSKGPLHPLFRHVSHLCVNYVDIPNLLSLGAENIPALTHLAIRMDMFDESCMYEVFLNPARYWRVPHSTPIQQVLDVFSRSGCTKLRMLMLIFEGADSLLGEWWVRAAEEIKDSRLFARPALREVDWERMMDFQGGQGMALQENGKDIWDTSYADWRGKVSGAQANKACPSQADLDRQDFDHFFE